MIETKTGKAVGAFYGCPGLDLFATCAPNGPIQALALFNGIVYAVAAGKLFAISSGGVASFIANVPGTAPAFWQMVTNGPQLGIVAGSSFYAYAPQGPTIFQTVALPFSGGPFQNALSVCEQDGYVLMTQPGTNQIWQSNLLDLTTWDGLNFASASGDPDNVLALWQQHREVFALKTNNIQIFVNGGTPGFVFQNLTDVFIEVGVVAQHSVAPLGETLVFLGQNLQGQNIVVQLQGYNPRPISTHAISHAIGQFTQDQIAAATAYSYMQEQHEFYVLNVGNQTWVYDGTESALAGVPMWHQRAAFSNGSFGRHWASCCVLAYGKVLVGDYRNGNIYALNLDTLTDNGTPRKWLRSWRALQQPTMDPVRFSELSIDMQTGIGVPNGTNPQVMLRWSDDGGHLWANQVVHAAGQSGQTSLRVRFNRLGSTRRATGLDRTFELSSTDLFPAALIGADLR